MNDNPTTLIINDEKNRYVALRGSCSKGNHSEYSKPLKENPDTSNINVIMLTALPQPEEKVKALSLGTSDYFEKVFNRTEESVKIKMSLLLRRIWNCSNLYKISGFSRSRT